ncbi:MAG: ferrochelatase [Formosimonas sp.]
MKKAIVLVNLGSPSEPTAPSIAAYLREFLSDRRVVDLPPLLWQPILRGIILRTRPVKLVPQYRAIWRVDGAPLKSITAVQARLLGERLNQTVYWAMRYQEPSIRDTLRQVVADGCTDALIVPMYPQFSHTTTSTVTDEVARVVRDLPLNVQTVGDYHAHPLYIEALKLSVQAHWRSVGRLDFAAGERLLLSFHGLPMRNIERGDPYQAQCERTHALLAAALGLDAQQVGLAYQSRFGAQKWLQPSTQATLEQYATQGCTRVDVLCPGFAADCLETLEEVALELKAAYEAKGGTHYHYIECLNGQAAHIDMLHALVADFMA